MKAFPITLAEINKGHLIHELTEKLQTLVGDCIATGKKGSLTLSLTLKPGKTSTPTIEVSHDVKVKTPEFERGAEFFFRGPNNELLRNHPDQGEMDLKSVDRETGEILPAANRA